MEIKREIHVGQNVFILEYDPFGEIARTINRNTITGMLFDKKDQFEFDERLKMEIICRVNEYAGILINWAIDSMMRHNEFEKGMIESYGYPSPPFSGFTVDTNGCFHYPDDPVLNPLLRLRCNDSVINFYRYAMFSIVKIGIDGKHDLENAVAYRMD